MMTVGWNVEPSEAPYKYSTVNFLGTNGIREKILLKTF